jgi:PAS domain S-box-containing protein
MRGSARSLAQLRSRAPGPMDKAGESAVTGRGEDEMKLSGVVPTGVERTFSPDDVIVSKTDPQGVITYVNEVFVRISGYSERELIGSAHNLIRHPDMPRCVFKLLWETIAAGDEIFAYVVNLAADGAHYWVLAHVTPTFGPDGAIVGYHSNRRTPCRSSIDAIRPIYEQLVAEEHRHRRPTDATDASTKMLAGMLERAHMTYDEFFWSLEREEPLATGSAAPDPARLAGGPGRPVMAGLSS